jgi:hypothetical protein
MEARPSGAAQQQRGALQEAAILPSPPIGLAARRAQQGARRPDPCQGTVEMKWQEDGMRIHSPMAGVWLQPSTGCTGRRHIAPGRVTDRQVIA